MDTNPQSSQNIQGSSQSGPRLHLRFVDGLRACAALYVVLGHSWLQTSLAFSAGQSLDPWTLRVTSLFNGIFAVVFFIAISGFCLMLPVVANCGTLPPGGARRFFSRRARRILPTYYAALIGSILVIALGLEKSSTMTAGGIVSHLLLVHNLSDQTSVQINGPLWSIAVECQIYLLFPLLVALRRRIGMTALLALTYFASVTMQSWVADTSFWGLKPQFLFIFVMGMYAAEVAMGKPKSRYIWLGCVAALLAVYLFHSKALRTLGLTEIVVGIAAMCTLIVFSHRPQNLLARLVSSDPLVKIGLFSYSLYLVHFPLQNVICHYLVLPLRLSEGASFWVMASAGLALVIAIAFGFYVVFERPFCSAGNRSLSRSSARSRYDREPVTS